MKSLVKHLQISFAIRIMCECYRLSPFKIPLTARIMNKAITFIVLSFIALVGLNWAYLNLKASTSSNSLILPSPPPAHAQETQISASQVKGIAVSAAIPNVPFFSQFTDIQSPQWQQVGCGIASLAMMIDFYKPQAVTVNTLLQQGIAAGAYDPNDGWIFEGLIQLSRQYGLTGSYYDLSNLSTKTALARFQNFLKNGPLILAVHNGFNPDSTLPHLVVVDGIKNNVVYYNDPAAKTGKKKISIANLLNGWEKKIIVLRPAKKGTGNDLSLK
jgi:uncharacterized protein YvpB